MNRDEQSIGQSQETCPCCNYSNDIRIEIYIEADGTKTYYNRCKRCAYCW